MMFLQRVFVLTCVLTILQWNTCTSLRILTIMPTYGRSHYFAFKGVIENLAQRGHQVTFISPFEAPSPIKNLEYVTLDLGDTVERGEQMSFQEMDALLGGKGTDTFSFKTMSIFAFKRFSNVTCSFYLNSPVMHDFKAQKRSYDLVIAEAFTTDCFFPFAWVYDTPLVLFSASAPISWYQYRFAQPANPSYVPNCKSGYAAPMTFWERMQNTIFEAFHVYYFNYIQEPYNYELSKKFFGEETPELWKIAGNASILLTNSHFSVLGPRASVPGMVEIGGIHLTENKALPKVSQQFKPQFVYIT